MTSSRDKEEDEAARVPLTLFDSITAQDEEPALRHGAPLWVITFADMITLLLAFFLPLASVVSGAAVLAAGAAIYAVRRLR
jgi:APA family basic amino acid/polyamine antiporter